MDKVKSFYYYIYIDFYIVDTLSLLLFMNVYFCFQFVCVFDSTGSCQVSAICRSLCLL